MSKSCLTCPSYLSKPEATARFGRGIGVAQCARFGTPLEFPMNSAADLPTAVASTCTSHGDYRPDRPINFDGLMIGLPDSSHMELTDTYSWLFTNCRRCTQCVHYVAEEQVIKELGFRAGLCKAKARLIPSNRANVEAESCRYRQFASAGTAATTDGVVLYPHFTETSGAISPVGAPMISTPIDAFLGRDFTDPQTYETDRPVEPEHKEVGIRAWRAIVDPENSSRATMLPIFDPDFFDEAERAKIPMSGDDEHPELYQDHGALLYTMAVLWQELDETPALWGEAGTGKTELLRHMAWIMSLPFDRISITRSTEIDDIAGKMLYSPDKGTHFQYGRIPSCWTKPGVLLLDEPNVGPPDVWHFVRPLTDNSKQLVVDMNEHENLKRNENRYLGLAMNPAWDPRNRGAEEIGDADVSRLSHIFMTLPPREVEEKIIRDRLALDGWTLNSAQMNCVMKTAADLRALSADQTIAVTWGLRPQIKASRFLRWFEPVTAYRRAIADYAEPEVQNAILDVVRANFPS